MQNFCIIVRLTKFTYIINYTLNKVQNFCIVVGLSRFKYPIKKKCRISASLFGSTDLNVIERSAEFLHRCWFSSILVSLNTECRISASWFGSADLSVTEQGAEYLHNCWVLTSVDLGVFSH